MKIKKIILAVFVAIASMLGPVMLAQPTYAADECPTRQHPWQITRWCEGLPDANFTGTNGRELLKKYIVTIIKNIGKIILQIGGYVAVVIVMYGGFLYITSSGDPGKAASGKKTITNGLIGFVIMHASDLIIDTVGGFADIFAGKSSLGGVAGGIATEFIFWGGAIAVLMMLWGGLQYVMSAGDPGKAAKAKQTLVYSLIGFIIMVLAAVIVNVVKTTFVD